MSKPSPPGPILLLFEHFTDLQDPRIERTKVYSLQTIVVIAVCAVICGADGWDDIALFGRSRASFFRRLLGLRGHTPCADTFRRVFERLSPSTFEQCFRRWVHALGRTFESDVLACDGKSVKRAVDAARPTVPLHLMHIWSTKQGLLVGQRAVPGAPGEVAGLLDMLALLDLQGATLTADANSCTAKVTKAVHEAKGDYVLCLKGNRSTLHQFAKQCFAQAQAQGFADVQTFEEHNRGHGRREHRLVRAMAPHKWPVAKNSQWTALSSLVQVERTRQLGAKSTTEQSYYLSSLAPEPQRLAQAIRAHWQVENQLHWTLDVTFGEDDRRIRDATSAQNLAMVARLALCLLKRESSQKLSIAQKRKNAGWLDDYLAKVLCAGLAPVN